MLGVVQRGSPNIVKKIITVVSCVFPLIMIIILAARHSRGDLFLLAWIRQGLTPGHCRGLVPADDEYMMICSCVGLADNRGLWW